MEHFKKAYKGKNLTCDDLLEAETEIVKYCQNQSFKDKFEDDLTMLKEHHRVKKGSSLYKLNPVLQEELDSTEGWRKVEQSGDARSF